MDAPVGSTPPRDPAPVRGDGPGLLRAIEARLPDVRLLADVTDRESYRRDETAYLPAGLPLAVALPTSTDAGRRRSSGCAASSTSRSSRAARAPACRAPRPASRAR